MAYDGILEPIYINLNTDGNVPNPQITLPVPPASGGGEQTFRHATHPPCQFSAGQGMYVVYKGAGPAVALEVTLTVANMDGTQLLTAQSGRVTVTPGSVGVNVDLPLTSLITGADLSYDVATQKVVSAAGGVFMATVEVNVVYSGS